MNDLALEIKKLADKYRNNQQHIVNSSFSKVDDERLDSVTEIDDEYFEEFDDQKLDELEGQIANLNEVDDLEKNSQSDIQVQDDSSSQDEIQISDFINPQVNVTKNSDYKEQEPQKLEFDREEKIAINGNLRNISKNLRDLKALFRS